MRGAAMTTALVVIVGMYVITRCVQIVSESKQRPDSGAVRVWASLTIVATVLSIAAAIALLFGLLFGLSTLAVGLGG